MSNYSKNTSFWVKLLKRNNSQVTTWTCPIEYKTASSKEAAINYISDLWAIKDRYIEVAEVQVSYFDDGIEFIDYWILWVHAKPIINAVAEHRQ